MVSMAPGSVGEVSWLGGHQEKDTAVIYVLDGDLRIVCCNETWDRFAAETVAEVCYARAPWVYAPHSGTERETCDPDEEIYTDRTAS